MTVKKKLPQLLRIRQVLELVPVARSTLWLMVQDGRFPKPTKLGPKTTVWPYKTVDKWLKSVGRD